MPTWSHCASSCPAEFALALTGFALLSVWRLPPWAVVLVCALGGMVLGMGA